MTAGAQHVGVHHSFRHFTWGILLERPVNSTGQPSDFMFLNLQKLVCALAQGRSDPMTWHATAWPISSDHVCSFKGHQHHGQYLVPQRCTLTGQVPWAHIIWQSLVAARIT